MDLHGHLVLCHLVFQLIFVNQLNLHQLKFLLILNCQNV